MNEIAPNSTLTPNGIESGAWTALDLPPALLYGTEGQWVRDDGGGAVRTGISLPALGREQEVVSVRLAEADTPVKAGQPIAVIEFSNATRAFLSPVDGTILCPNPSVREEPRRIFEDPYGEGYLFDLEEVETEALGLLMDRDRASLAYQRLPDRPPLEGSVRYTPGERWPVASTWTIGGRLAVRAALYPPQANRALAPDWLPGDRWRVEARTSKGTTIWEYLVEGRHRLDGHETWQILLTPNPRTGSNSPHAARRLHIDRASLTLLAWDLVVTPSMERAARFWNPRGTESYVWTEGADPIIVDMPHLAAGADERERTIAAEEHSASPALRQHDRFSQGGRRLEVALRTEYEDAVGRRHTLLSEQVWQNRSPWWLEARRIVDGEQIVEARLLSAHGYEEDSES